LAGILVHGGIRHLEIYMGLPSHLLGVHGGIRHLEMMRPLNNSNNVVHGGIRHLEIKIQEISGTS